MELVKEFKRLINGEKVKLRLIKGTPKRTYFMTDNFETRVVEGRGKSLPIHITLQEFCNAVINNK